MYKTAMDMDGNLKDQIPLKAAAINHPDSFGVEVELEGKNVQSIAPKVSEYWGAHLDHSLRAHNGGQAIEYTFNGPYNMEKTIKAVDNLFDVLNSADVQVHDSYRTSIHVHVNFAMESFRTMYNFMCLCFILDELLVSQNGDHRIGNNFCLRVKDAMGQMNALINSINNGHGVFSVSQNERYSSINFASLNKFGSIEFRSLECTTHKGRVMHWINTLQEMKKSARQFKNPTEIIALFSQTGPQKFLFRILGPYALKYANVQGYEDMLRTGMRIAQDFAYCSEWKAIKEGELAPKLKKAQQPKKLVGAQWELPPPQLNPLYQILEEAEQPYDPDDDDDDDEEEGV